MVPGWAGAAGAAAAGVVAGGRRPAPGCASLPPLEDWSARGTPQRHKTATPQLAQVFPTF